jgi:hypothetical protein
MTYKLLSKEQHMSGISNTVDKAKTEWADYAFRVKELGDGEVFISLEPRYEPLPGLGDGFLSLALRNGTTMEQAKELAQQLSAIVSQVGHTRFQS